MTNSAKEGSALKLMGYAAFGALCIGAPLGYGFARLIGLSPATAAWITGLTVPVTLLWLWRHRAPGNTRFCNLVTRPATKPGSPSRLMAKAMLAVVFLVLPMTFALAKEVAHLEPEEIAVLLVMVLVYAPVWLWRHRSPDNTRFTFAQTRNSL